jgi:hypothetical protein
LRLARIEAVNALYPAAPDDPPPRSGPRLYSGPSDARLRRLREWLEGEGPELLARRRGMQTPSLPVLWHADFMLVALDEP